MSNRIKSLLLVLAALVLVAGCQSSNNSEADNSWRQDNMTGKVKRVLEVTYNGVNDRGTWRKDKQTQLYKVKTYNESGFLLTERNFYSDSNQPAGGFNYTYDAENNLLKVESVDPEGGVTGYSEVITREGKVRILEYSDYYGVGDDAILTSKTKMTWEGFKLSSASTLDAYDELISTSAYTYDDKGNLASFDITSKKPQERYIKMNSEYAKFDDQGNWTVMFKQYESMPIKEFIERQIEYFED